MDDHSHLWLRQSAFLTNSSAEESAEIWRRQSVAVAAGLADQMAAQSQSVAQTQEKSDMLTLAPRTYPIVSIPDTDGEDIAPAQEAIKDLDATEPSICIPRVFPNISRQRIKRVMEGLNIGTIDRIDMVNKTNAKGATFKRVFIHFKEWNDSEASVRMREKLINSEQVKIFYERDESKPWFWKVSKSTAPKPDFTDKPIKAKTERDTTRTPKAKTARKAPSASASSDQVEKLTIAKVMEQMANLEKEMSQMRAQWVIASLETKPEPDTKPESKPEHKPKPKPKSKPKPLNVTDSPVWGDITPPGTPPGSPKV